MTGALSAAQALDHLLDLSSDIRAGVVLDSGGRRLAGGRALAGPARELLGATDAPEVEVSTGRGTVFASRARHAAIVVVAQRSALPALMLYDLRVVLGQMEDGG
jgi:hypothetical protein